MPETAIEAQEQDAIRRYEALERQGFQDVTTPDIMFLAVAFGNLSLAKYAEGLQIPGQTGQIGKRVSELSDLLDKIESGETEEGEDE